MIHEFLIPKISSKLIFYVTADFKVKKEILARNRNIRECFPESNYDDEAVIKYQAQHESRKY